MKFKQLSTTMLLSASGGCFAAASHPITFQNDTNDTGLSVNYITGHKYSKCVTFVRPQALMIAPGDAEISIFRDKNSKTCRNANKRASWMLKAANGSEVVLTFKHEPESKDIFDVHAWKDSLVINGEKVKENDIIPFGNYQLKINHMNYVTLISKE